MCGPLSAQGHILLAQPSQLQHSLSNPRHNARGGGGHRAKPARGGAAGRSSRVVPERHSWWGELEGASGVAPGKEIGVMAHPSGRSTSRQRHLARWWHSSALSGVGGDEVLIRWADELLSDLL
jgi:hypothetical protein